MIRGPAFAIETEINFWCSKSCNILPTYFICNAPSELCLSTNNIWEDIDNNGGYIQNTGGFCEFTSNSNNSFSVIGNKLFTVPEFVEMEMLFTIHNTSNGNNNAGLVLDFYGECYWYFYIGMRVNDNNIASLFIANVSSILDGSEFVFLQQVELFAYNLMQVLKTNSHGHHHTHQISTVDTGQDVI